jgi:Leucine Rich repeat
MSFELETLAFPTEYSLGRITVYRAEDREPYALLDARGIVEVPRNAKLILDLSQEICADLTRIKAVPPRLLEEGLHFFEKNLDATDFRQIPPLMPTVLSIGRCERIHIGQIKQLGELSSLQHLNFSYTTLDVPDFLWLKRFPNLKSLRLTGTGATGDCIKCLANPSKLEVLELGECSLTDQEVQDIWRVRNLQSVNLRGCRLGDAALRGIGACSELQSLHLEETLVSDEGIEFLVAEGLRSELKISSLGLRGCGITDKSLVNLAAWKQLRFATFWGSKVTPEGGSESP